MSKSLEALKRIRQETCSATYNPDFDKNECCDIIEQALKEYERLLKLRKSAEWADEKLQTKKKLKALEIIKGKRVDLEFLFEEWEEENWEFALKNYNMNHEIELTQEEYDLLREVFE